MNVALNFIAFQVGWFSCVLGAANGLPWAGPAVVLAVVAIHLWRVQRPAPELKLVLAAMGMGVILDSALLATGWVAYPSGLWLAGLAPYWIIAMWGLFATTLNVSMRWLHGRPLLAGVLGAVGGPLSYLAGERLGGIELVSTVPALAALALGWGVAMPLLARWSVRLDGVAEQPRPAYVQADWRASERA